MNGGAETCYRMAGRIGDLTSAAKYRNAKLLGGMREAAQHELITEDSYPQGRCATTTGKSGDHRSEHMVGGGRIPVLGDVIVATAGAAGVGFARFTLWTVSGKLLRYALLAWVVRSTPQ